jgi:hypothetical protein
LTYIRRQSGLDSRAALFVLSPVSQAELGDFVKRFVLLLIAYSIRSTITLVFSKLFMSQL